MKRFAAFRKSKSPLTIISPNLSPLDGVDHDYQPAPDLATMAVDKLMRLGLEDLARKLSVSWNPRMRSTAGLAYPVSSQIVLNPRLTHFGKHEVERTLLHELAHLIAHHRSGHRKISPHGQEWKQACRDVGLLNEARCHDLPLPRRVVVRELVYQCPSCLTLLERVKAFRRPAACMACCKEHSAGRYDDRFKLIRLRGHATPGIKSPNATPPLSPIS